MNTSSWFRFRVDTSEIAEKLKTTSDLIENRIIKEVESLSISAHSFIVKLAKDKWANNEFKRDYYLGIGKYGKESTGVSTRDARVDQVPKHLRWIKIGEGMWVVELDEKAKFLEEGREPMFMDWLLKPGDKGVKQAKDGSFYKSIPFKQTQGKSDAPGAKPMFAELVRKQAKRQGISLSKIEKNEDGSPKLGILHKLNMRPTLSQTQAPSLFSKPRTEEDAALTGLRPHSGIYKLEGAVVTQTKNNKGKVKKETIVFRTISSKHKAEGRWFAPKVEPFNGLQQAYENAEKQWELIVKNLEKEFSEG